jgi:replicative DNA helicase
LSDVLESARKKVSDLAGSAEKTSDFVRLGDFLADSGSGMDEFLSPRGFGAAVPVPWPKVTAILGGGLRAGELVVLAGRPAHGKTAIAGLICHHAAKCGKRVMLASLEQGRVELWHRLIASSASVDMQSWRRGALTASERRAIMEATGELAGLPLWISDQPRRSAGSLESALRRQALTGEPAEILVVDYLQLMTTGGRSENRMQEISALTREMKLLAKEHGIPVVVLAQIRRYDTEDVKPPAVSMLRESGSIEQDADIVMIVWQRREHREQTARTGAPCETKLDIAKQRNGPIGAVTLWFQPQFLRIDEDVERARVSELREDDDV